MTFIFAFESHTTTTYAAYATSNFKGHSLLSASRVVNAITMLLTYPIVAKLSDVGGPKDNQGFVEETNEDGSSSLAAPNSSPFPSSSQSSP